MSVPIAMLEKMQSMGLTLEQAIDLAKMWEEGAALPSPNALRQRRHRERKRGAVTQSVMDNVTRNASDNEQTVSPTPPSEITPIPPLKGGTFPKFEAPKPEKPKTTEPQRALTGWVSDLWQQAPLKARQRSSTKLTENALRAAVRGGADPARIVAGLAAYYTSADATKDGGEYAKGVHRAIQNQLWEAYEPQPTRAEQADADPWPARLLRWRTSAYWNSEWGPKPGKPGYRGPPPVLDAEAA
jgi:hypothetical protein